MKTLDDWQRVKRVLEGALEREGADREAYLADACGSDAALRTRVDVLLAARDRVGTFLESPAARLLDPKVSEDLSGRVVSSYRLISRLGAGGMGEVYLAHDTKLDRQVALKVLAPELARDRDRLRRFHQEARAASSLNHPHILVVHDFGELDGRPYLVTELIEGETLRERLRQGPLPVRDVVEIGVQVSSALAAAHARGLVHRDIKPENVMLRPDGYAKVLDFGLAKLATLWSSRDPNDTASRTQSGMVVGTPRYMSPEQARGLDVDARSDVFSLGLVLYEMATGGLSFIENSTAIEGADADPPPELLRILSKALQTVPDLRYPSAGELCADLKHLHRETESLSVPSRLERPKIAAAVVLAIVLGSMVALLSIRGNRVTDGTGMQKSLAVLPFDNVSADRDFDYLRLALADEVATALSSTPSLAVRPMASSRKFVADEMNPQEAGRQLRVGGIVTGHFSIQRSELHVTVEAVEVEGNRLLWSDTITAPREDSIALRDRLTSRVRNGLVPALGAGAPAASDDQPRNAEAYALYLKSLAMSTDPEPNREAIAMLERASEIDPEYVDTWLSLADRYYDEGHYGGGGSNLLRLSEAAARQALALDPNRTAATVRLFALQVEAGRLQDGYDSALKLVEQRPESGEAHYALSYVLRYGGLLEESARECEEAVSRDSTNPLFRSCAQPLIQLGRYDRAIDFVRLDTGSEWSRVITRLIYQRMGRRSEAREQHDRLAPAYLRGVAPEVIHGLLARCLAGAVSEKQEPLSDDDVQRFLDVREDPEPLYFWASDLAYCGQTAAALTLLRESVRRNYCACLAMEIDPMFDSIRGSAEYGELLAAAQACRGRFREHVRAKGHTF
jgi:serine/threonine protein kinase/tetratricopeptide (TPR) repeat protein